MQSLTFGGAAGSARGVLQVHVVQSKQLRRTAPLAPALAAQQGFAVALHVGLFHSAAAAAADTGVDESGAAAPAVPQPLPLRAGADGTAVWNQEVEFEFRNADAWLFVHAQAVPLDAGQQQGSARRRSKQLGIATLPGEARVPIKEYASRVYHDLWLPLGLPAGAGVACSTPYVTGMVHVRFLWLLEETPRQLAALARIPPPLAPLLGTVLQHEALWLQVLVHHASRQGQEAPLAAQSALVQSVLSVLAHARFGLVLQVLERLVTREVDELGRQHNVSSAWAYNLFRRNSTTSKLLSAFCLQQPLPTSGPNAAFLLSHEGVGKPYLVALLVPYVQRVLDIVSSAPSVAAASPGASVTHGAEDALWSNPFETDPSRVANDDRALLERNQANLLRACQALIDIIMASMVRANEDESAEGASAAGEHSADPYGTTHFWGSSGPPAAVPEVPLAIRSMARSIRRIVEEYATRSAAAAEDGAAAPAHIAHEATANGLASFFFLRFLCPALVAPVHYGLLARQPPPAASRALILIAKLLQSLVNAAGSAAKPDAAASAADPNGSNSKGESARLFKESWLDFAYPFVNANLPRISRFLAALGTNSAIGSSGSSSVSGGASDTASAGACSELLPGVEGNALVDPPALDVVGGVEASPVRDLERALWTLLPFLQAQMAGLEECATQLHRQGVLRIPVPDQALSPASSATSRSGAASPLAVHSGDSGLSVLRDLTRPRHYDTPTSSRRSSGRHRNSSAPAGPGASAPSPDAHVAAFVSRFRSTVMGIALPPAVEAAYQASMARRSNPVANATLDAETAAGLGNGFVAATLAAPAAVGERLAQAATHSLKFLSRFLPASGKDAPASPFPHSPGTDGASQSVPVSRKSSRLAPPLLVSPAGNGASPASFSSPSAVDGSTDEAFALFKQTSVEVQLRLTAALEDADQRAHSLLVSFQHEEERTREQQEQIQRMQAQIDELKRENEQLRAAAAAGTAAAPAAAAAAASASASGTVPVPLAAADDFSTSPLIQVTANARVRRARPDDIVHMDAMIRELAVYEREPDAVVGTSAMLHDCLFGPNPRLHAHVLEVRDESTADDEGEGTWRVQGMAIWFLTYSTWLGRHGIWLEDLYVRPSNRGSGLGRALLRALAAECVSRGYQRLDWYVLDWNAPAHRAYRAIGAAPLDEWSLWRLHGDKLASFARGDEVVAEKQKQTQPDAESAAKP